MKSVVVVAPHPDDETLGCGGALLKHVAAGDSVHWVIVTTVRIGEGFSEDQINLRKREIEQVASTFGFESVHSLGFPTMTLDMVPKRDLINSISAVIKSVSAQVLYLPYRNDAHSDHAAVFDAAVACAKTFRYPSIRSVRVYETLSETEFGLRPDDSGFRPNLFIDISPFLEQKLNIMNIYASEMAEFPFPRSRGALEAQARLRGSQCGAVAAESFMLLKEIR